MDNTLDDSKNRSLIEEEDTQQVCSQTQCKKTPELYVASLKCNTCGRSVHYRCTGLPPYMIEFFVRRFGGKQRKWCCQNCISASKEVKEAVSIDYDSTNDVTHLRRDIAACENLVKAQQETICQQNSEILSLRKTIEVMTETIGRETKSLSNQIKELTIKVESKPIVDATQELTFANAAKSSPTNLREIIKEARNEEQKENRDKQSRKTNIIIHGVPDKKFEDQNKQETWNEEYINKLLLDLKVVVSKKKAIRLGTFTEDKKRPMKVVFGSVKEKETVMKSLKNLKGIEGYEKTSITDDHTKAERNLIKLWADKAKERNEEEPKDSNIIWRVRGTPGSGIHLKKFAIKKQASQ